MPDIHAYLARRRPQGIGAAARAVRAWQRIQDRPTAMSTFRLGTAQTVRIEYRQAGEQQSEGGTLSRQAVLIFGVIGHPDGTVLDTDLRQGDRFVLDGSEYEIVAVMRYPGELQAIAERVS